jgi:hypothetical protein
VTEEVASSALPRWPLSLKHRDSIGVAIKEMAIEEVGGSQGFGNLRPQWNLLKLVVRDLMTGG